jgi:ribonuclease HI
MNQLHLFAPSESEKEQVLEPRDNERKEPLVHHWQLFVDGASRNNPGKSGAGIYILKDGVEVIRQGFFLGIKTNNEAEYLAAILGLFFIQKQFKLPDKLSVISDSLLVIRQLEGIFKVRKKELIPLHQLAHAIIKACKGTVTHVLRHHNVQADAMANEGIDKQIMVPHDFIQMLKQHGITL